MMGSEAAVLLAKCSAFDQRTIGRGDAAAWAEVLTDAGVNLDDALEIVTDHYRTNRDRIMAADIIDAMVATRRARLKAAIEATPGKVIPLPGDLDQADERRWRRAWIAAAQVADPDPVGVANRAVGIRRAELEAVPMPDEVRREIARYVKAHAVPSVRT